MNAPFVPDLTAIFDWTAAADLADVWRGRCLELFGRAERAISETLIHLNTGKPISTATFPRMLGQKVAELERLLAASDAVPAAKALTALRAFREQDPLRSYLCHGTIGIMLDEEGEWHVLLRMLVFKTGVTVRDERLLSRTETESCHDALRLAVQRLVSHLTSLRAA
ncbi:MAG: hypothetical protein ACRYFW_12480 [Janthinobacterium lividum]